MRRCSQLLPCSASRKVRRATGPRDRTGLRRPYNFTKEALHPRPSQTTATQCYFPGQLLGLTVAGAEGESELANDNF